MIQRVNDELRVWVDGRLVDRDEPSVAATDHGLTVGDGVFETMRVDHGVPFALTRHLARLAGSAAGLGLSAPDEQRIRAGIDAVLGGDAAWPLARLRVMATSGTGPLGSARGDGGLTYVVLAQPIEPPAASTAVAVVEWTRNERSAVAGLKTTSYAENAVALAHAQRRGASEALLANTRGQLCEGTGSNVVVVLDGQALTPSLGSGCLAGITRELLLEWAEADGVPVREAELDLAVLQRADEVLLTSSTRDVQPVHAVDDRAIEPGPVGERLRSLFRQRSAELADP